MAVPVNQRVPESIGAANIQQERKHRHGVADQADKGRRASDGLVAFEADQVDRRAQ